MRLVRPLLLAWLALVVPAHAATGGAEDPEALAKAFQQAHVQKNYQQASQLIYWEGVDAQTRAATENYYSIKYNERITGFSISNVSLNATPRGEHNGQAYELNLSPTHKIVFRYQAHEHAAKNTVRRGAPQKNELIMLVGKKGERYYIVMARPVK